MRRDTTMMSLFAIGVIGVVSVLSANAQSCGLKIGAFLADSSEKPTAVTMPAGAPELKEYTAYALDRSGEKYASVLSGGLRYFGEIPEGQYTVYVKKAGYKTTIQPLLFACGDTSDKTLTGYIKLWGGSETETVTVSEPVQLVREMRLDRMIRLGPADSDTGYRVIPPGAPMPPEPCMGTHPTQVSGGVLNGKAVSLSRPGYPAEAKAEKAAGSVTVQVLIDHSGKVISASAVSGHPLLRPAAESAARGSVFQPTLLCGQPVKVSGVITYNFIL